MRKSLLLLVLLLALAALGSPGGGVRAQEPFVEVTFLDVGQGDAVVVRAPEGQTAMIDAGRGQPLRSLMRMGIEEIDLLVATHPHADHIGGMDDVLTARPVRFYMDNGRPHTTETYLRLMATLERLSDVVYLEATPRTLSLGSVELEVLPLPPAEHDHNDRSVGLVLRFGAFSALLSGDSERAELDYWTEAGVVPDVTLLKAPHHGAANGYTTGFLERARPEVVVVSVGGDNPYLHPRPEALTAYGVFADEIYRTDLDGHVTVLGYADGRWEVLRGSELAAREPVRTAGTDVAPPGGAPVTEAGPSASEGAAPTTGANPPATGASPPASEAGPPTADLAVTVVADAPGHGPHDLNREHVVVENLGPEPVAIGRWLLCDLSSRCFRFPDGTSIGAGRRVVVYTGYGTSDGVSFFMNNNRAVWNDDGDEASLFDANGNRVLRHVYE